MESSLVPGTPVGQLFGRANPYGPQQVMSPRASGGCPYGNLPPTPPTPPGLPRGVLFAPSLLLIDERLHVQRGQEEASASRLTFELNQSQFYQEREAALQQELREINFEEHFSLQAQQQLNQWEQEEAAAYQARLQAAESRCSHAASARLLGLEEQAIHHYQLLRQGLATDEQNYRASLQQEARFYHQNLQQELLYHQNAQAQAESLLAAERQQSQKVLQEQTDQWEAALQQVVRGGEEALERERTLTVEAEGVTNIFRLEHQEALQEVAAWEEWCQTEPAEEEAEPSNSPQEQEVLQGYSGLPAGSSPLTPPVMQQQTLLSRHLPPSHLPFQDLAARESENSLAAEIAQEQATARAVLEEAEASASHQQLAREDELRQARQTVRLLEEGRVGSGAPSFTPTLTPPIQPGFTSQLTIGQPQPVTPSPGTLRGPWAATRERLQQTATPTPLVYPSGLSAPSSGLPSLSGIGSAQVAACPVFASPTPATPQTCLHPNVQYPPPQLAPVMEEGKIDFKREKSALPKLQIKGGDATSVTRTIHEWLQRTSIALNTWSASAVQLWHNAVALAKAAHQQWTMMAPSQRALQTGLPSTGHALPAQLSVLEAIMRSDLCNHCLPEKIQSLAIQKGANTVADLLYLTFQSYLPSEPTARVEGLATIEAPVKPSRTFSEALSFLRSWRQQVLTVVHDLGGNPEPLKLYSTLRTLISSLVASDNAFAMEVSQIYRQTGIKTLCNDVCLLTTIDLLEVELASRAQEDEEEKRKQKNANVAVASFTSSTGSTKTSTKPICRNFMTENGCNKGGQCTFSHPATVGRCLRCGSTKHAVAECKRPRKDPSGNSTAKGKGKGKGPSLPKSSSPSTSAPKAKPKADTKKRPGPNPKAKGKPKPKAAAASSSSQAMHCLMWAEDQTQEQGESLSTAEILPSASLSCYHDADYFSACTFYTTFTPAFHSTEPTDADGILPPILDTGATHCLLPLKWMTHEQAESCKKIHLKVASGATVRALLHENVIYCSTVSRPLVSVGQLKGMLDLRMIWDDSSPKIIACSGGLRYILIEAAVFHNLPVITHQELHALLGAIHDFTQTGTLYNAATWSK